MPILAPTAVSGIVAFLVGVQSVFGWNFLPEQWTGFLMVAFGIIVYLRQVFTGKSTWFGSRK